MCENNYGALNMFWTFVRHLRSRRTEVFVLIFLLFLNLKTRAVMLKLPAENGSMVHTICVLMNYSGIAWDSSLINF